MPVCLFLLAFLPRALYPVSRPLQWYFRSARFLQAVLHRDWAGTLFSEHPGVTVMWLSGAVLWGWQGVQSLAGRAVPSPLDTEGFAFFDRVSVGVLPLAMAIALGIVWGWHLLRRLFGRRVAWVAAVLWLIRIVKHLCWVCLHAVMPCQGLHTLSPCPRQPFQEQGRADLLLSIQWIQKCPKQTAGNWKGLRSMP